MLVRVKNTHIFTLLVLFLLSLMIIKPQIFKTGAFNGLLLSARVIIPSLFPFSVAVLFLLQAINLSNFKGLNKITQAVFALFAEEFFIFFFSMLGGYPIGAKLLNEAVKENKISSEKADIMLSFCVGAGSGFTLSAIGCILNGKLARVLFLSNILSSFFICFLLRKQLKKCEFVPKNTLKKSIDVADNFVLSVAKASESTLSACSFVCIFSAVNAYFDYFGEKFAFLKTVSLLNEVTNAVTKTQNIYIISFLVSFSGFCVWFQVLAITKYKVNIVKFILSRILHGAVCASLTFSIVKIFKISVKTLSNNAFFKAENFYSTPVLTASLLVMATVFIISVTTKKYTGKILEDVV